MVEKYFHGSFCARQPPSEVQPSHRTKQGQRKTVAKLDENRVSCVHSSRKLELLIILLTSVCSYESMRGILLPLSPIGLDIITT